MQTETINQKENKMLSNTKEEKGLFGKLARCRFIAMRLDYMLAYGNITNITRRGNLVTRRIRIVRVWDKFSNQLEAL